jgi:hypothetical protein
MASSGALAVPSDARIMVISTDFTMQDVLSEDFSVARRSKPTGTPQTLTLTVSVIQRVLQPGVSAMDLAPGVPHVPALLKAAGYFAPVEQTGQPLTGDAAAYMSQGNPTGVNRNYQAMQSNPMNMWARMNPYGGPPTPPDPRDPRNQAMLQPDLEKLSQTYDTAVIAHAVLSDGKGELTAVAVAHPNEDLHDVKRQLAERIANAVLH